MSDASDRLIIARKAAGYKTGSDAARAMKMREPTYLGHENGSRGIGRAAARYARFFRVSYNWLVLGQGEMRPGKGHPVLELYESLAPQLQSQAIDYINFLKERSH